MTRRMLYAAGLFLLEATSVSFAQQTELVRIRGTIEAVDGSMLTVKSRDGQTFYKVRVAGDAVVRGLVRASLGEIKDNTFIGISGLPQPDGSQRALEIHIFPESMRGTGEGHQPWDLIPNSTMTNAAVVQMVKAVDGDQITVKYKGGEKKIIVLPQTRIVTFVPGDKSELRPGVKIFIAAARKKADGTLEAGSIAAGRDGLPPPMRSRRKTQAAPSALRLSGSRWHVVVRGPWWSVWSWATRGACPAEPGDSWRTAAPCPMVISPPTLPALQTSDLIGAVIALAFL